MEQNVSAAFPLTDICIYIYHSGYPTRVVGIVHFANGRPSK